MEEIKTDRIMTAASVQALKGRRVFTGIPNVKLIMVISLKLCLDQTTTVDGSRSCRFYKIFTPFLHFIRNCTRRTEGAPLLAPGPVGNFDNTGVVMNHHQKARILKKQAGAGSSLTNEGWGVVRILEGESKLGCRS